MGNLLKFFFSRVQACSTDRDCSSRKRRSRWRRSCSTISIYSSTRDHSAPGCTAIAVAYRVSGQDRDDGGAPRSECIDKSIIHRTFRARALCSLTSRDLLVFFGARDRRTCSPLLSISGPILKGSVPLCHPRCNHSDTSTEACSACNSPYRPL